MVTEIRIHVDDLIPRLQDSGIIENIEEYSAFNRSCVSFESWLVSQVLSPNIEQVYELLRDWKSSSGSFRVEIDGVDLSGGIIRPEVPSGLGTNGVNIWFTPPDPLVGVWRFYVNGILRKILPNYNNISVEEIGAHHGDIVQVCEVKDGIVGWWGRIQI